MVGAGVGLGAGPLPFRPPLLFPFAIVASLLSLIVKVLTVIPAGESARVFQALQSAPAAESDLLLRESDKESSADAALICSNSCCPFGDFSRL